MSSLFSKIRAESVYRAVRSPIEPYRYVESPKGLRFGLPWPWEPLPLEALLDPSDDPDVVVAAPRSDGRHAVFTVTVGEPWDGVEFVDRRAAMSGFASRYGVSPVGARKVLIAGVRGQVFRGADAESEVHLLMTSLGVNLLVGVLQIPNNHPGYLHHFDSMLATWEW